jgi:hypothetical protein
MASTFSEKLESVCKAFNFTETTAPLLKPVGTPKTNCVKLLSSRLHVSPLYLSISSKAIVYFNPKGPMHENDKLFCNNSARMLSFLRKILSLKESHNHRPYTCGD